MKVKTVGITYANLLRDAIMAKFANSISKIHHLNFVLMALKDTRSYF